MLTPIFELSQTQETLVICVRLPYAKVSDMEVYFEGYSFMLSCKPYYLRLNLPGKVLYSDEPPISYDVSTGHLTVTMTKATEGESFEGLDMLTKLLAPKRNLQQAVPKIEVIGGVEEDNEENEQEDEELDWEIEQQLPEDDSLILGDNKCGFANLYSCSVFKLKEESSIIFDVMDPDKKPLSVRHEERSEQETEQFSDEHYLADLYEDEEIQSILNFLPDWSELHNIKCTTKDENFENKIEYTKEEKERLLRLPNKEYILDQSEVRCLFLGLVDILSAYAYNKRTTSGENTVESGWTINKLSATLNWMENFTSLETTAQSSVRRSLVYPLFRHWELSMEILNDTIKILSLGQKYVLKCFLEIHQIFCECDPRYILNDLFITDYCVWIQGKSCSSEALQKLSTALQKVNLQKCDINLGLLELEYASKVILQARESSTTNPIDALCSNLSLMKVENSARAESSSDSDSSSDSESCDSSEESSLDSDDDEPAADSDDVQSDDGDDVEDVKANRSAGTAT